MKNWKTTLIGVGSAIMIGAGQMLQNGNLNWKDYLAMAFTSLIGIFAKDCNVTGGAVKQ